MVKCNWDELADACIHCENLFFSCQNILQVDLNKYKFMTYPSKIGLIPSSVLISLPLWIAIGSICGVSS